jgi:hypothetical protein
MDVTGAGAGVVGLNAVLAGLALLLGWPRWAQKYPYVPVDRVIARDHPDLPPLDRR